MRRLAVLIMGFLVLSLLFGCAQQTGKKHYGEETKPTMEEKTVEVEEVEELSDLFTVETDKPPQGEEFDLPTPTSQ